MKMQNVSKFFSNLFGSEASVQPTVKKHKFKTKKAGKKAKKANKKRGVESKSGELEKKRKDGEETKKNPQSLRAELLKTFQQETMFDCAFIVGKGRHQTRIEAHKMIMSISSPIFHAMLNPISFEDDDEDDLKVYEEDSNVIEVFLPEADPDTFKLLVSCLYFDKVVVQPDTVGPILDMASKYQVAKMQALCAEYLEQGLPLHQAIVLYLMAPETFGDPLFGLRYLENNTPAVFRSEHLGDFSKERMLTFLKSNHLCATERQILKGVVRWGLIQVEKQGLDKNNASLQLVTSELLPYIRFTSFTKQELTELVIPTGILPTEAVVALFDYSFLNEKDQPSMQISLIQAKLNLPYRTDLRKPHLFGVSNFVTENVWNSVSENIFPNDPDCIFGTKLVFGSNKGETSFQTFRESVDVTEMTNTITLLQIPDSPYVCGAVNMATDIEGAASFVFAYHPTFKRPKIFEFKNGVKLGKNLKFSSLLTVGIDNDISLKWKVTSDSEGLSKLYEMLDKDKRLDCARVEIYELTGTD